MHHAEDEKLIAEFESEHSDEGVTLAMRKEVAKLFE